MPVIRVLPLNEILALNGVLCGKSLSDLTEECLRLDHTMQEVRIFSKIARGGRPKKEDLVSFLFHHHLSLIYNAA